MTIFWLITAGVVIILGLVRFLDPPLYEQHGIRHGVPELILGSIQAVISIGVFLRTRWGYYGGLILSAFMVLAFPIGTILGVITIKAYVECKYVFNVR